MPLVLVFLYDRFFKQLLELKPTSESLFRAYAFLGTQWAQWSSLSAAAILTVLYLSFRLRQMKQMYGLVASEESEFKIANGFDPVSLDKESELSSAGCLVFISRSEIRRIARKNSALAKSLDAIFSPELQWFSRRTY